MNNNQSELAVQLHHGSVFTMSKASQGHFEHCIPKDFSKRPQISITLRQIQHTNQTLEISPTQNLASTQFTNIDNGRKLPKCDGYQGQSTPPSHFSSGVEANTSSHPTTLFISSSMFRDLDLVKLSSEHQKAEVLFYPGATAGDMLSRLKHDPKFKCIDPKYVTKIFLLTGTNNIDRILNDSTGNQMKKAMKDVTDLINFLHTWSSHSTIYNINILPRTTRVRNEVINHMNNFLT